MRSGGVVGVFADIGPELALPALVLVVLVVMTTERVGVPVVVLAAHAGVPRPLGGVGVADVRRLDWPVTAAQMPRLARLTAEVGQEAGIGLATPSWLGGLVLNPRRDRAPHRASMATAQDVGLLLGGEREVGHAARGEGFLAASPSLPS